MTDRGRPTTASDAALIADARLGDRGAFEALAVRHRAALTDLGGLLTDDPAGLVDQTLEVAHRAVRRVQGPHTWMRGYLLQLMCRLHAHQVSLDPDAPQPVPFRDEHRAAQHDDVATEFAGLADAWQAALWHRSAERETSVEVATVVGVSRDKVGALVRSAEAELRRALLLRRWQEDLPAPCRAHARRMLGTPGAAASRSVLRHAARCAGCAGLLSDLDAVRRDLPHVLARHLLGDVGAGYLELRRAAAHERVSVL